MTRKEAIKVMQRIQKHFMDIHYPLKHAMYDRTHTVGQMFNRVLEVLK